MTTLAPLTVGIMQGRLLPPIDGRVQSFPREGWQREFALAAELGYQSIELTIETASVPIHPLLSVEGRSELTRLSRDTGVALAGLCCDTVMERPLVAEDAEGSLRLTEKLLQSAGEIGLPMIELPMMGKNSLKPPESRDRFAAVLDRLLPIADKAGTDILLEADVEAAVIREFLIRIGHPRFGVNYDCGNSTWFGFHPDDEFPVYAQWIRNVHVKDCTRKDYSVPLGQGETPFDRVFAQLHTAGYQNGFILQAARQPDDLQAARHYLQFTRKRIDEHLSY